MSTIPSDLSMDDTTASAIYQVVGSQRATFSKRHQPEAEHKITNGLAHTVHHLRSLESSDDPPATFVLNNGRDSLKGPKSFSFALAKEVLHKPRRLTLAEAYDLWEHAVYLHTNMSVEEAIKIYWMILRGCGDPIPRKKLWANKGLAHLLQNQAVEACTAFSRSIAQGGHEPIYLFLYATQRYDLGHYEDARDAFQRCVREMQDHAEIDYRKEGMSYTLLRADAYHNENMCSRRLSRTQYDVQQMELKRIPTFTFFYSRAILPPGPDAQSYWSADSSDCSSEKGLTPGHQNSSKKNSNSPKRLLKRAQNLMGFLTT